MLPDRLFILLGLDQFFRGDGKGDSLVRLRCDLLYLACERQDEGHYTKVPTHHHVLKRSIGDLALLLKRTHYPSSRSFALLDLGQGNGKQETYALGDGFADFDDFISYRG
jgi:hypothetical protein